MIKDFSYLEGLNAGAYRYDIWIPEQPLVVLGRSRSEEQDLNLQAVMSDSISIIRRVTGGGTVYLDSGCIVVDIAYKALDRSRAIDFIAIGNSYIVSAFDKIGIHADTDPLWPDVKIGKNKVSGSSLAIKNTLFLFSASIIYGKQTIEGIEKYIEVPTRAPSYRQGRNHRDFLLSIDSIGSFSQNAFVDILNEVLSNAL